MNAVTDPRAFSAKVQATPKARFRLKADGTPYYEPDEEEPDLRHYVIDLTLESPRAREILTVTHHLDDETFYDKLAVSDDPTTHFQDYINTYGDVPIETTVLIGPNAYRQRDMLSHLLEAGHANDKSPAIRDAIERIKRH